jgi:type IV pilus assembly protein PilA
MRHASGFSLLELLIVLSVVSILAVVAVPLYLDYDVRAKVSEGVVMVGPPEKLAAEYYQIMGRWPLTYAAAGMGPPNSYQTDNVASIGIAFSTLNSSDFKLVVTYRIPALGSNNTLTFTPAVSENRTIQWDCRGGTLLNKYRPPVCKL